MNISKSIHAQKMMLEKGINDLMISAAMEFGESIRAAGSLYYFLGKRAVKRLSKIFLPDHPERWEGLVLVCDPKGQMLITCFKNKNWLKRIRHKK